MRRPALAFVVTLVVSASMASAAHAAVAWAPCPGGSSFQCATVPVPLDPSGATPGTINLKVQRKVGKTNPSNTAIVALAGGPGQAALPLAAELADQLKSGLVTRDMLTFDQRGTGSSGALKCSALTDPTPDDSLKSLAAVETKCANQIGTRRGFYTTAQSVADIEALRVAAGYTKLTLFGVSYGTKVAEEYAQTYPQNVSGLVLDSVVTPTGPDAFNQTTFTAIPRVLSELCGAGACTRATPNVNTDLASILKRTARSPIFGNAIDGHGHREPLLVTSQDMFSILLAGDLNPELRAELPGALHGARRGDTAPLLRVVAHAEGLTSIKIARADDAPDEDGALFLATTCEESILPWPRTVTDPTQRRNIARAAIAALPASTFAPFTRADVLNSQSIRLCLGWPQVAPLPATLGPLPTVPTLIIEGQADLRTTVADAKEVADAIPGSTLLVVPHVGHSVLGADISGCAQKALDAFFAGATPKQCPATTPNDFPPLSAAPTSVAGLNGASHALKTALAVRDTIADEHNELITDGLAVGHIPRTGSRVGGLRSGFAMLTAGNLKLTKASFVPGVSVSGTVTFSSATGTVQVSGPSADHGTLHFSNKLKTVTGTLGGHRIDAHFIGATRARAASVNTAFPGRIGPALFPLSR